MGTIVVEGVGKAYKHYESQWARLLEWTLPGRRRRHRVMPVLHDISFRVDAGEAVGIMGVNGAGKSTLLKIITGTTWPSAGRVQVSGRVAAMLELGMGFHPDFSGRQNVYMAGQLLGFQPDEITRMMDDIIAFAEIGDYIDEPVRVYSSGMQVRLAFSVATARRPDVLIVDEALSVGDAYFQHKSFARIRQFAREGTTLLLVSHDKQAIQSICSRAILLHQGRVALEGTPEAVTDYYNAILAEKQDQQIRQEQTADGRARTVSGTGHARVSAIELRGADGRPQETLPVGEAVTLHIEVETAKPIPRLVLGYAIKDRLGQVMYGTNTHLKNQPCVDVPAGARLSFDIRFQLTLGPGTYSVQTALTSTENHLSNNYEWRDLALVFTVVIRGDEHFAGCNWMDSHIEISHAC